MKPLRFIAAVVVSAAIWGGWRFWNSGPMELRRVEVAGNEKVTKEEIAAASELSAGMHLLKISVGAVSRKVESIPWVSEARVERIIPSSVRISVEERSPRAEVVLRGRSWLVDAEGMILEEGSGAGLKIVDLPVKRPRPGVQITVRQFHEALAVFDSLDPQMSARVRELSARTVDRITLTLDDRTEVVFGAAEEVDAKNYSVRRILEEAAKEGRGAASIDVRVPDRPAVRFR